MEIKEKLSKEKLNELTTRAFITSLTYYKRQQFFPTWISLFINPLYMIRKALFKAVQNYGKELHGVLLDVGCGTKPYGAILSNAQYHIGVDEENVNTINQKKYIDFYFDGKTLPFDDNYFDSAICAEYIGSSKNPEIILNEISRVCKSGSALLITAPFVWYENDVIGDYHRFSADGIITLLEKTGYQIVEVQKLSNFMGVLFQMVILYVQSLFFTKNKYINLFLNVILIAPFTIFGTAYTWLLPQDNRLYFGTAVLARKK